MLRYLLFDIDDTLLNFRDQADTVIRTALADFDITFGEAEFAVYHRINGGLWKEVLLGTLSREELCRIRWTRVLNELQLEGDGPAIETRFRYHLARNAVPECGAADTLRYLSQRYVLATASNAPQAQQEARLKRAGLDVYFTHVFTSGGIGVDKPSPLFFKRCLETLGNPPSHEVMMLGDSPEADVMGGAAAGLQTCLVNTRGVALPPDCHPTLVTPDLPTLMTLL